MVLTERDYKQIEMESLIEREFSRILRLTRIRDDNVTSYVGHIHRIVFSRHGTSEGNLHQSATSENSSRAGKDSKLFDNTDENGREIPFDRKELHVEYKGTLDEMKSFVDKVWKNYHMRYPKATYNNDESLVKMAAEDYFKRKLNLPLR